MLRSIFLKIVLSDRYVRVLTSLDVSFLTARFRFVYIHGTEQIMNTDWGTDWRNRSCYWILTLKMQRGTTNPLMNTDCGYRLERQILPLSTHSDVKLEHKILITILIVDADWVTVTQIDTDWNHTSIIVCSHLGQTRTAGPLIEC